MEFKNVTVIKKANVYFDGNVTSRTVLFEDGIKKTLGFMLPGEYKFSTGVAEIMEVMNGEMDIKLAGEEQFTTYTEGQSFSVAEQSSFDVVVKSFADYCCSYA